MISNIQSGMVAAPPPGLTGMQEATRDLAKSLRKGDLDGAKQAFADVVRQAPEGASWPKGGAFAELGRALVAGDLDAAKTAFGDALKARLGMHTPGEPVAPPVKAPVPAASGGVAGGQLHVVA